ncbi:hypothetical protein Shyhy02_00900 [Streptomyces hygroscopicus subsp. hygroscopicus]|nr:hypothetical protein Shyhy02_00900 [Streptomyces hygroscopicus subsp. hygroscopicus]
MEPRGRRAVSGAGPGVEPRNRPSRARRRAGHGTPEPTEPCPTPGRAWNPGTDRAVPHAGPGPSGAGDRFGTDPGPGEARRRAAHPVARRARHTVDGRRLT